ncbi:ATP-dependent RNA helicase DbpA [Halotalea alkalilenta]|uniref:ATP-dependent RNA helicase DbpA n=1 Tax=Halotalea alkalilenta TaxID=376489 RepID=UPI00048875AF|nr:ATP-dependent RNA helicase DbpA [Halotalea alkalilenta]
MTLDRFDQLALSVAMRDNLASLGYAKPTPVQSAALPPLLEGFDLIIQAQTGGGKTAAFGIGLLERLNPTLADTQSLVLCPTRELAEQVASALRRIARAIPNVKILALCGGVPIGPQIGSLEYGAQIVVGTPGRIDDLLRKGALKLDRLRTLVLDEADRMLEMGFREQLSRVIAATPEHRQTLLFSATFPDQIEALSADIQREPRRITVAPEQRLETITQYKFEVDDKPGAVAALLHHYLYRDDPANTASTIVFCNTKRDCDELEQRLRRAGFSAASLHGDLDQRSRDQVLARFSNHSVLILIATDVASRGLDIKDLDAVINVDPALDPDIHLHRIGRTGRAGASGLALSLYTAREARRIEAIEARHGEIARGPGEALRAEGRPAYPPMVTLDIDGGRKHKLRPGDIVGALTRDGALDQGQIGKIAVGEFASYVAVESKMAKRALVQIQEGRIKGRRFRARLLY